MAGMPMQHLLLAQPTSERSACPIASSLLPSEPLSKLYKEAWLASVEDLEVYRRGEARQAATLHHLQTALHAYIARLSLAHSELARLHGELEQQELLQPQQPAIMQRQLSNSLSSSCGLSFSSCLAPPPPATPASQLDASLSRSRSEASSLSLQPEQFHPPVSTRHARPNFAKLSAPAASSGGSSCRSDLPLHLVHCPELWAADGLCRTAGSLFSGPSGLHATRRSAVLAVASIEAEALASMESLNKLLLSREADWAARLVHLEDQHRDESARLLAAEAELIQARAANAQQSAQLLASEARVRELEAELEEARRLASDSDAGSEVGDAAQQGPGGLPSAAVLRQAADAGLRPSARRALLLAMQNGRASGAAGEGAVPCCVSSGPSAAAGLTSAPDQQRLRCISCDVKSGCTLGAVYGPGAETATLHKL